MDDNIKELNKLARLNPSRKQEKMQPLTLGQAIAEVAYTHNSNGGCTYDLSTGKQPKSGFAVGVYGYESRVRGEGLTFDHVSKYCKENIYSILIEGYHLGTWYDNVSGYTYIDCVKIFKNKAEAMEFGKYNAQKSIYNLKTNETLKIV